MNRQTILEGLADIGRWAEADFRQRAARAPFVAMLDGTLIRDAQVTMAGLLLLKLGGAVVERFGR